MVCSKGWGKIYNRTAAVAVATLLLLTSLGFVAPNAAASPDYSETWSSADGDNDTTEKYVVVRDDAQKDWSLSVDVWEGNRTVLIEMENIAEGTLNLSELGVNMEDLKPWIDWAGAEVDIVIRSDVHEVDITINDLPEFDDIYLNGDVFDDYTYDEGSETLSMTLTFSENTLTVSWDGMDWTVIIELVWAVMTFMIVIRGLAIAFNQVDGVDFDM